MSKTQSIILFIGLGILGLLFLRKKHPDLLKQINAPDRGGGGGNQNNGVPTAPAGNVLNSVYGAVGGVSKAVSDIFGLWGNQRATTPENAYVGQFVGSQAGTTAHGAVTGPTAEAVNISGFDAPRSFDQRYAGYA
jgi:hypothetical protein